MSNDDMRKPVKQASIEKSKLAKQHIEKAPVADSKQKNEAMKSEQKNCCE